MQCVMENAGAITYKLADYQLATLSRNHRNKRNISAILCIIRDQYAQFLNKRHILNRSHDLNLIFPEQIPGHIIHGPKIVALL